MNTVEIINKIKEIALSQATVSTAFDGDVYKNWNSAEVKYASVNVGVKEIVNEGNKTIYSVILYYGDRLLQSDDNVNSVYTDAVNTLQSIINILNTMDNIDISEPVTYTPFEQKFMDYLAGAYCQVDIMTDSSLGYCNLDNYVYIDDKDKLIEELIEQINKYKTEDAKLSLLLQEILYKINGETII